MALRVLYGYSSHLEKTSYHKPPLKTPIANRNRKANQLRKIPGYKKEIRLEDVALLGQTARSLARLVLGLLGVLSRLLSALVALLGGIRFLLLLLLLRCGRRCRLGFGFLAAM